MERGTFCLSVSNQMSADDSNAQRTKGVIDGVPIELQDQFTNRTSAESLSPLGLLCRLQLYCDQNLQSRHRTCRCWE
jgi:hypothetical protein